ncbi:MAG: hypothetical protein AAFO82_09555 [Bacteroidota bacterium]
MNMEALQIVSTIKQFPLSEKLRIMELVFRDIREETAQKEKEAEQRRNAAALLLADYQEDEELTVFTALDQEDFYETK